MALFTSDQAPRKNLSLKGEAASQVAIAAPAVFLVKLVAEAPFGFFSEVVRDDPVMAAAALIAVFNFALTLVRNVWARR